MIPEGRLSLTSGVAVPTSNVVAATAVNWVPVNGGHIPLWDGSQFTRTPIGAAQLTQALADAGKSPGAAAPNLNYDVFAWLDGGTVRATRGPAWTQGGGSAILRGNGPGSTALAFVAGVAVNAYDILNGPAAGCGRLLGSIRTNAAATVDYNFGGQAVGGAAAMLGVWNAYNQVMTRAKVQDSAPTWNYAGSEYRCAHGSPNNRIGFICGLPVHAALAEYFCRVNLPSIVGAQCWVGFGLDQAYPMCVDVVTNPTSPGTTTAVPGRSGTLPPQTGFHTLYAVEASDGTSDIQFVGAGILPTTMGLEFAMLM